MGEGGIKEDGMYIILCLRIDSLFKKGLHVFGVCLLYRIGEVLFQGSLRNRSFANHSIRVFYFVEDGWQRVDAGA